MESKTANFKSIKRSNIIPSCVQNNGWQPAVARVYMFCGYQVSLTGLEGTGSN